VTDMSSRSPGRLERTRKEKILRCHRILRFVEWSKATSLRKPAQTVYAS